jgi:hypothetical protein
MDEYEESRIFFVPGVLLGVIYTGVAQLTERQPCRDKGGNQED